MLNNNSNVCYDTLEAVPYSVSAVRTLDGDTWHVWTFSIVDRNKESEGLGLYFLTAKLPNAQVCCLWLLRGLSSTVFHFEVISSALSLCGSPSNCLFLNLAFLNEKIGVTICSRKCSENIIKWSR